jgi:hypothetical protein
MDITTKDGFLSFNKFVLNMPKTPVTTITNIGNELQKKEFCTHMKLSFNLSERKKTRSDPIQNTKHHEKQNSPYTKIQRSQNIFFFSYGFLWFSNDCTDSHGRQSSEDTPSRHVVVVDFCLGCIGYCILLLLLKLLMLLSVEMLLLL